MQIILGRLVWIPQADEKMAQAYPHVPAVENKKGHYARDMRIAIQLLSDQEYAGIKEDKHLNGDSPYFAGPSPLH